ncbi:putative Fungal specific transcription factor [Fonsecaea pedrosoi]|nr:putative Fungal specific transcription factor [Fonsecaea pedrosoi]
MPPEGEVQAKRRYSSNACMTCRRAKIRCDNRKPRCSNCVYRDVDCLLGQDGRKPASGISKNLKNNGANREDNLSTGNSSIMSPHGSKASGTYKWPTTSSAPLKLGSVSYSTPSPVGEQTFNPFNPPAHDEQRTRSQFADAGVDYWIEIAGQEGFEEASDELDLLDLHTIDTAQLSLIPSADLSKDNRSEFRQENPDYTTVSPAQDIDPLFSNDPEAFSVLKDHDRPNARQTTASEADSCQVRDEPTEQLASRLGCLRIAEDGHLRYYGATSNLHLFRNGLQHCFQPSIRTIRTHGQDALERAGLHWSSDPRYEDHLTTLFFAWHNPFLGVVDEAAYYHYRQLYRAGNTTIYFSPTLENAILGIGAAYATRKHPAIKDDPAEFFAHRSKVLLDIEMDSPNVATIQALVTLSAHEAAYARDSRGWLYTGMAVQLLSDLGLHLELDQARISGHDTPDITNLRRTVFWATQGLDILWSAYSGRPSSIRYDEQRIPFPKLLSLDTWRPYVDEGDSAQVPAGLDVTVIGQTHVYMAQLTTKIRKISRFLYTGPQVAMTEAKAFARNMMRDLRHWRNSLPAAMQVPFLDSDDDTDDANTPIAPAVIMLHLQFLEAVIFLQRPFISAPDAPGTNTLQADQADDDSGSICDASANAICRLVVIYRQQWNLRRVHAQIVAIILTAALIHVHNCCVFSSSKGVQAHKQLSICFQALGEMSHFNMSTRALEIILSLRRDWQDQIFGDLGRKRLGGDLQRLH